MMIEINNSVVRPAPRVETAISRAIGRDAASDVAARRRAGMSARAGKALCARFCAGLLASAVLMAPPPAAADPQPQIENRARTLLALEQLRCAIMVEALQQELMEQGREQDARSIGRAKDVLSSRATDVLGENGIARLAPKMIKTVEAASSESAGDIAAMSRTLESRCQDALNAAEKRLDFWRNQAARATQAAGAGSRQSKPAGAPVTLSLDLAGTPVMVPVPSLQIQPRAEFNFGPQHNADSDELH